MGSFLKIATTLALSASATLVGTGCAVQPDVDRADDEAAATGQLADTAEQTGDALAEVLLHDQALE